MINTADAVKRSSAYIRTTLLNFTRETTISATITGVNSVPAGVMRRGALYAKIFGFFWAAAR
jgi:hypothetical protein